MNILNNCYISKYITEQMFWINYAIAENIRQHWLNMLNRRWKCSLVILCLYIESDKQILYITGVSSEIICQMSIILPSKKQSCLFFGRMTIIWQLTALRKTSHEKRKIESKVLRAIPGEEYSANYNNIYIYPNNFVGDEINLEE